MQRHPLHVHHSASHQRCRLSALRRRWAIRFTTNSATRIADATLKAGKMQHVKVDLMLKDDGRNWSGSKAPIILKSGQTFRGVAHFSFEWVAALPGFCETDNPRLKGR